MDPFYEATFQCGLGINEKQTMRVKLIWDTKNQDDAEQSEKYRQYDLKKLNEDKLPDDLAPLTPKEYIWER